MRTRLSAAIIAIGFAVTTTPVLPAHAVPAPPAETRVTPEAIDAYARHAMKASGVPGMSLVVTRGRRVVHAAGYGHDSAGRPVTARTPMRVASLSKSVTAAAVMTLVDEGRIALDRPVAAQMPEFQTADPMLASRARRKVQGTPPPERERRRQRAVVDAFLAAARNGDFEGLVRLLHPQVTWRTYHPQGVMTTVGAAETAGPILRGFRSMTSVLPVLVNDEPGFVAWGANGKVLGVAMCTVVDGRIVELLTVSDRRRLDAMGLPARPE